MPHFVRHVQPPLSFIPPAYNLWLLRAVHWALPLLLRVRLRPWLPVGIAHIEVVNGAVLAQLYHEFQQGDLRFVMAFRHVEVEDPLCGLHLLSRAIPQVARQQGILLQRPLHAHFLYDRGMPLWAGTGLRWAFSRLGGISIRRGRQPDWSGLRQARKLLTRGDLPLVIAPEGATNGHSERVGPLESGAAQLAFWCAGDLAKADRPETVKIIPINIQYRYVKPMWSRLGRLLTQLEQTSGLPVYRGELETPEKACYARILRLGEHLLSQMEAFYRRVYHQKSRVRNPDPPLSCAERLQALLESALQMGEQYFGLTAEGNLAERCRRLEEAGWQDIYRDDLPDRHTLSPLDRGLADWLAQAASLQMLHMRLVETFVAVDDIYLKEKPSFERCAEITLLMFDLLARLRGDQLPRRPRLGDRQATLTVGEPISVSDRWPQYRVNHQAARQAVKELTEELQQALERMICT
ncbi:MAG: 1-acyl-sn-glycerol-3-phosphate acyltransferase [Leptolyngbya sp. SIOISBB]|nr:1-acyl-sn-glycerol-3-phosphate acyltransferase [Leptolyngbya sp. SIOISBB]